MKLREICLWEVLDNRTKLNVVKALEKARDILSKDYRVVRSKVTNKGMSTGTKIITSFDMDIQFEKEGDDSPFKDGKLRPGVKDEIFKDVEKEFNRFRIETKEGGGTKRPEPHTAMVEIYGHRDGLVDIRVLYGNPPT